MKSLSSAIFSWYQSQGRHNLPWRKSCDPYHILISEIMLQQTQVSRVIEKYQEFLSAFPTAQDLANAKTSAVITAWKGLGYNRRALFLQKAAQVVVNDFSREFPKDLETLKTLPGVGDYTARAILSFAFDQPVAMMDTNHRRIYNRIFVGIEEKKDSELLEIANKVIQYIIRHKPFDSQKLAQDDTRSRSYHWNQALMDFGSMICTTRKPSCNECPVKKWCKAYPDILTTPIKKPKRNAIPFKQTDRYVRGRIIDMLREKNRISASTMQKTFPELPALRYERIIKKLLADGLIQERGRAMVLPE